MTAVPPPYRISGHESFPCHYTWLPKAVRGVGGNYSVKQGEHEKDITDFLKDIFSSSYSEFLLNFGTEQLMASLEL
jgi:hypothetical protein